MRTIDADELMEQVRSYGFDPKGLISEMIRKAPTVETDAKLRGELEAHITHLEEQAQYLKGQIRALAFAVRCNGVSGGEVAYEKG